MRKLCLVIALLVALPVAAETLEQFDKKLEQQLQALDPGAVAVWLDANRARATNHHADAVRLYAAVYRRVRGMASVGTSASMRGNGSFFTPARRSVSATL